MPKGYLFVSCIWRGIASALIVLALTCVHAKTQDRSIDKVKIEDVGRGIAWQPFTSELLKRESSSGKNVLLVVVADWCQACQQYLKTTLMSEAVSNLIREKRVTALIFDITTPSAEVKELMVELKVKGIPGTIIYPASKPDGQMQRIGIMQEQVLVDLLKKLPVSMQTISK